MGALLSELYCISCFNSSTGQFAWGILVVVILIELQSCGILKPAGWISFQIFLFEFI